MSRTVCDGRLLKWLLSAGVAWLKHHREQVNNLNVFPVPDGDTGTNMVLTLEKAYQELSDLDDSHPGTVAQAMAKGALMGARGNSGTILSMLLRGFAGALRDHALMDAAVLADACQQAVDYAYETVRTVMDPVEGTILTVARETADAVAEAARTEDDLKVLLDVMVAAAYDALERTPEQLPVLKEAGVVDSGGMGFVYLLEGMQRLLDDEPVNFEELTDTRNEKDTGTWRAAIVPQDEAGYGYDVQFLMLGDKLDVQAVRRAISEMGWSPLVDGDETMIKVHVHVHDPGQPLSYAISLGVELDDVVVENMQAQYLQYVRDREARDEQQRSVRAANGGYAVITVARGEGIMRLFRDYGADRVIEGGQTMNPGTEDFVKAIDSLAASNVFILPNNGNVRMAAEQAAGLIQDKAVQIVPSKTVPQGINALLAYGGAIQTSDDPDDISQQMTHAMQEIISAEVTTATRSATLDGVRADEGDLIGLLDGKMTVAGGTLESIVRALLDQAEAAARDLATLYYGTSISEDTAQALIDSLSGDYGDLEFELIPGGQPLYPYIISIE